MLKGMFVVELDEDVVLLGRMILSTKLASADTNTLWTSGPFWYLAGSTISMMDGRMELTTK